MRETAVFIVAMCALGMPGAEQAPVQPYVPSIGPRAADVPEPFRCKNYKGGSCVHASTITAFRWSGQHDMADWWRQTYAYGEYVAAPHRSDGLMQKLDRAGVPYAYTSNGDPKLLEDASRTRRPAVITYKPNHAINFLGYVNGQARLLDNNRPGQYEYVPKDQFLRAWRSYGGNAVVLLFDPPPPRVKL